MKNYNHGSTHRYILDCCGLEDHLLSDHEKEELREDFGIDTEGFYVLACLSEKEWEQVIWQRML